MQSRIFSRLTVLTFFCTLWLVGLSVLGHPDCVGGIQLRSWTAFCRSAGQVVRDQFVGRAWLREHRAAAIFKVFGESVVPEVTVGRDGWLFFSDAASRKSMRRSPLLSDSELQAWASALADRSEAYAKFNTRLWLLLPPDKHSLYDDALPLGLITHDGGRLHQLVQYLQTHTHVPVVDSLSALRESKSERPLFFRQDTHWNTVGQAVAYEHLLTHLKKAYPVLRPKDWHEISIDEIVRPGGDLANIAGLSKMLSETAPTVQWPGDLLAHGTSNVADPGFNGALGKSSVRMVAEGGELRQLFMFGDSFGESLLATVGQHFQQANFWRSHQFDDAVVAAAKPEVVIFEMLERYLYEKPAPEPYRKPDPFFFGAGFFEPESDASTMFRWMGQQGELKLERTEVPMRLTLDVEGGLFEVKAEGNVLGRIDAVGKRTRFSLAVAPSTADTTWRTVEITALSPLRRLDAKQAATFDVADHRRVSGRIFDVQWRDASL